jgi:hypothetical protein
MKDNYSVDKTSFYIDTKTSMTLSTDWINKKKNTDLFLEQEISEENYCNVLDNSHVSWINVAKGISCTATRVWITSMAVEVSKECYNRNVIGIKLTCYNKEQLTVQLQP